MAQDVSDVLRGALGNVAREALKNVGDVTPPTKNKSGPLSGAKGIMAGMGLAAAAPLAKKGVDAVRSNGKVPGKPGGLAAKAASMAGDRVGSKLKDVVGDKVDEAGGAGGLVKEAAGGLLPFGGGGGDDSKGKGGTPGVGKGRRMPVQQAVDVGVPIETAYNQWTQFEDWAQFMHRITNVSQDDPCTVNFSAKIWTRKRDFEAKIITQRPNERIKWRVAQGITHTGVVTFHELAPRLTRMEVTMDVDPGSLIEKIARGSRHIKRAVRADLHRYKAFIEMLEHETGAWRGVIEDGELVEDHDPSYDDDRDYADVEDLRDEAEEIDASHQDEEDEEDEKDDDDEQQNGNGGGRERTQRFKRQAERSRTAAASRGSSSRSTSGSGGSRRSSGSSSGGSGRSKSSSSSGGSSRSKSASSGSRSSGGSSSSGRSRSSKSSSSSGRSRSGKSKSSGSTSSSSRRKSTSRS